MDGERERRAGLEMAAAVLVRAGHLGAVDDLRLWVASDAAQSWFTHGDAAEELPEAR